MKNLNLSVLIAVFALAMFATSCENDELAVPETSFNAGDNFTGGNNANFSEVYGRESYLPQLAKGWWQYIFELDCFQNPLNSPLLNATLTQTGPVVFLAGSKSGFAVRNVVISRQQTLFIPVINTIQLDACASGKGTAISLASDARKYIDQVSNMNVKVDGKPAPSPRIPIDAFTVKAEPEIADCLGFCVTGQEQTAASDGYYLILNGLKKGKHTVKVHAEIPRLGVIQDAFYTVTVK